MKSRTSLGLLAAAATALVVAIAFFARASPSPTQHRDFMALLAERHDLDQDVALHALEARFQLADNYDQLKTDDLDLQHLEREAKVRIPTFLRKTEREELDGALARYATLAAERQSLVETFKSKNALLKNSVNYFPSLVADVLSRTRDPVFVAMVTELRGQTLNLALRDDARLSEAQRQSLSEVMASIPAEFDGTGRRTLELMLAHARVIAREKERTDSLLRQILDVPLDSAREGVSLRYQSYYARARTQAEVFGNFVSGLAVVLLLLVAYAGVRLQRAASELSRSNDRLEAAVAKRTAQLEQAMARREHMEIELRQAQKLETVGQLASGIAHEINTPIQYVGDSVHFLRGAFADVARVLLGYQAALAVTEGGGALLPAFTGVRLLEKEADLESLNTEIPEAFERTLDGTRQVAHIVSSMKTFAHASEEKGPVDLNAALENSRARRMRGSVA